MKILLVAQHYPVASGRYMYDTLKSRIGQLGGVEVRSAGYAMGTEVWGGRVAPEYEWKPYYDLRVASQVPEIAAWAPDLILVMDSDPLLLDWCEMVRHLCPIVVYGVDNHVREYFRPWFSHYFLAHDDLEVNISRARRMEGLYTWLPCATDDYLFPMSPIPWGAREHDVACIGVMYPNRWEMVYALRDAGLKVVVGTGVVYREYRHVYQNSRIALVQSIKRDLSIRVFEGLGMGCAVLAHDMPDLHRLDADPVTTYETPEEAVQHAIELIGMEPKIVQKAVEKSSDWALRNHTWLHRAQVILNWYNRK